MILNRAVSHSPILIASGCLLVLFLLSLFFFFVPRRPWTRRVLFFPKPGAAGLYGETRLLPERRGLEESLQLLVDELILGPVSPKLSKLMPREVRADSVIARKGVVYLNLSRELVLGERRDSVSFDLIIEAAGNTVLFNFPQVRRLYIFVDGQVPGARYFAGVRFNPRLIR